MSLFTKKIHVHFIDASSGKTLGETRMDANELPKSFGRETRLTIAGEDWSVVTAAPKHAEEYERTGTLVLHLSRILLGSPRRFKFTIPTVSAEFPPVGDRNATDRGEVLGMKEDDWRQVEFVSLELRDAIDSEFTAIGSIVERESIEAGEFVGFNKLHVREGVPEPLGEGVLLAGLKVLLGTMRVLADGAGIRRNVSVQLIDDSFAFETGSVAIYGHHRDNRVDVLGVRQSREASRQLSDAARVIQSIMLEYRLVLIDWCRMRSVSGDRAAIERYLSGASF